MIKTKVTFQDVDKGLKRRLLDIKKSARYVEVGVLSDEDEQLRIIAGAHEFGATIKHPGGTSYGYKTEDDAKSGKMRFLKKGEGYMVVGETQPHTIEIPQRSFIASTVDENEEQYLRYARKLGKMIVDGIIDSYTGLTRLGMVIEKDIKNKIVTIKEPPNSPQTIKRKGSDNPLIDTGLLLNSIRYVVVDEETAKRMKES